jgi:hypothetical protein
MLVLAPNPRRGRKVKRMSSNPRRDGLSQSSNSPGNRRLGSHRALLIDDILRMIVQQLTMDHQSLAALAQTCKACYPIALKELWRVLSSKQLVCISSLAVSKLRFCWKIPLTFGIHPFLG